MGLDSPSPQPQAASATMVAAGRVAHRAVPKLNARLVSMMGLRLGCLLLVGCGLGLGVEMGRPTRAGAQTTAEATAKPRLKVDGVLDEKSQTLKDGRYFQLHFFEGQAGEKLTVDLSSGDFDLYLIVVGADEKKLAEDNNRGGDTGARLLLELPTTGLYGILVTSAQPQEQGRYQLHVRATTPEDVTLAEAEQLNQQVFQLNEQGKYQAAIPLAEKALQIRQRILGRHPDVATSLNNLAFLYQRQGRYEQAEPLFIQALEMLKALLGERHPDVATSLNNLAVLHQSQGRYEKAEPLYIQALEMRKALLGERHPDVASSLNNLAGLYESQGRYEKAEPLYIQALEMRKALLGERHPDIATSLNNLAVLYKSQGRYEKAEPLYIQALEMRKALLGERHPDVASSLNNLAGLYESQGRYEKAEPLFIQALEMRKALLGERHPDVASSLNNLAGLYRSQGRYEKAEPLYIQALEMRKALLGERHPDVATSLTSLAELYRNQGRYEKAEPLSQQALEMSKVLLGGRHPDVATNLNNLAVLYQSQGRYEKAEPLYIQALEMRKALLGERHPDVASSLNNLAGLYRSQERYEKAEPLSQQALEVFKALLGERHPDVASSLNNLAGLYYSQGRYEKAIALFTQGLDIQELNLTTNLAIGADNQKRDYIATLSGTTDGAISLHLQNAPNNPQAADLAFTTLLRRKGRILDATHTSLQTLRQNLTPADQTLLDQLADRSAQLSALTYRATTLSPDRYRATYDQLTAQIDELQATLARRSTEFKQQIQPITLAAVQAQIPDNTALVEITQYKPFNPKAKAGEKWGTPRYAAYLLTRNGSVTAIDLGEAAPIDQLTTRFRRALRSRDGDIKAIARQLDSQLMQPIRAKLQALGAPTQLLISPDGQLNLIPFAALVDETNRYLVETYDISYLTSGRDLLRLGTAAAPSPNPALILANPDYDRANLPLSSPTPTLPTSTATRSADLSRLRFGPLLGTAQEAAAIAPKLPRSQLFTNHQATENILKQTASPAILHIATHGFFLEDIPTLNLNSRSGGLRADIEVIVDPNFASPAPRTNTGNALLRSGLALAGANPKQSGSEDGILTALELASLNLRHTQLVVLSACETGIGDVINGEGVYGLRRALVLSGAASQLISLWKVDDNGTKDLMVQYYDRLLANQGRSLALRQVQLDFLKSSEYRHPYFWAGFIPSGDWRSLPLGSF
jgi:CHAT domain-containing protein/Flp pilus assembly protein TadD